MAAAEVILATGRRKSANARVRLFPSGDGTIEINGRPMEEYFCTGALRRCVMRPLLLTEKAKAVNIKTNVAGGGISGQAGAVAHGITRALLKLQVDLRPVLKAEGLVTRDPRMKERKKYGQPGARKRFQFSKR